MSDSRSAAPTTAGSQGAGVPIARRFTESGKHPFDCVEWEIRDAVIGDPADPAFEQRGVEFPSSWSQNATNIVAQKYFRGRLGSDERERSVKQMIGRVAGTIAAWGREGGYFGSDQDASAFEDELTHVLLHQMAAFNSPVWFNVGFEEQPQCSACQPHHALVSTPDGLVPIGELVDNQEIGREVFDADGTTRIVAAKHNGLKRVWRVHLRNGQFVEATPDHVVKAATERRAEPLWLRVDELAVGMRMHLHPHRAKVASRALVPAGGPEDVDFGVTQVAAGDSLEVAEAALAGWLQADGFVGQYSEGTNRSLTIEFQVANDAEYEWVMENLDVALPENHRHVREADTQETRVRRIRLYGEELRDFVDRWELMARGLDIRVPKRLWTASHEEIAAYLKSLFQADGYVTLRRDSGQESGRVAFAVISERWTEDIQLLLNVLGIYSRRLRKREPRDNRHDLHEVQISIGSERARFAELIGFVDGDKSARLQESLGLQNLKACPDLREETIVAIEPLGDMDVYDIQTESGEYLSNNVAVHNCFILSVEDTMESILDWNTKEGMIFRGGSGSGINLSKIRASTEHLSKGGYASGPVSFMRGADAWAGTIKSGGKTRRAAKMVVLDVDHPDVLDFIWCKAREEEKAAALRDAGFDMRLDSEAFASIQYQNANNSVRVSDEFMDRAERGEDWELTARQDGSALKTVPAREVLDQIADAAWRCADPGLQYDTTINDWHTCPNSGRINASNPCFPADARVHTTLGLLPFRELYERAQGGEEFRVYTHRATADEPGKGVVASQPIAVMKNGVKRIVRLRFANGQELRCTPNHRLWTVNRGYVQAEELTFDDHVLLNDSPTPADDASWALPVKVEALAKSFSGGTVTHQPLPETWSEGLGELTGHLVGDGDLTEVRTEWIYGGEDIADGVADSHEGLLRELIGGVSRQEMDNGTVQLRAGSEAVREFFRGLGVSTARAHEKRVPRGIFTAPTEVQAAFLRGLFGADGCVSRVESGKASRYVGLGSRSEALLKDVQRVLNGFGVRGRTYEITKNADTPFTYTRKDGSTVEYESRQGYDLRITGSDLERFAEAIGFSTPSKQRALDGLLGSTKRYGTKGATTLLARDDDGQEVVYNLTEPLNHSYIVDGVVVANCSEYMHVDDSACNLASINLLKFRRSDGSFDVPAFEHVVDVMILAQEIVVGPSSYPTSEIGRNARDFRQLGLGYANLGALLMADGLPYDSDEGRAACAAITALMTGRAYRKSAEVAEAMGPYARYYENQEPHLHVMRKHQAASYEIPEELCADGELLAAARRAWDEALAAGEEHGYRNAQATVLAPTGTISFLMDCDTTGIEPDFSLVKFKELVGGGQMTIVNRTIPAALRKLGYSQSEIDQIEAHVAEKATIVGAPGLKDEHLPVFDVAVGERAISHMGHIKMMAAAQPFISGAISKCVTGNTLVSTREGLVRIGSLHKGERDDSFRDMCLSVASLDGVRDTDAFYYGGVRETIDVTLRSGHRITGTPNHRVLVGVEGGGLEWRRLDEIEAGDQVATQYGDDLWSDRPARFDEFEASPRYGSQQTIVIPEHMTEDLAFFLGAYVAEGHITRSNHTVKLANADDAVIKRLVDTTQALFGIAPRVARQPGKCPSVELSSKSLVEFIDFLRCGDRAANKRIPDAVLGSPRPMVLAFLEGLSLDCYLPRSLPKWALCVASNGLLDDLQAILTNLGIVHSRITKYNAEYEKSFDEVYTSGRHTQRLTSMLRFPEAHKAARAADLANMDVGDGIADLVPGISGRGLYDLIPKGRSDRSGNGTGVSRRFSHLVDPRTARVSRASLEAVATVPEVELPEWLDVVLDRNLHFSPVTEVEDGGEHEVFDISVPDTHAFVGNGIVNHNTVNLPESATVADIADAYVQGWKLGLKALAIYRDGSKTAQALKTDASESKDSEAEAAAAEADEPRPMRRRMPKERMSITHKFSIAGHEGYITAGMYEDGSVGEIFLTDIGKEGSTLRGMMNAFATSVSIALQYGVPLETLVRKFSYMRFDPEGITGNPEIPFAKSLPDYIMRWLASRFLDADVQEELGILTPEVRARKAQQEALLRGEAPEGGNGHGSGSPAAGNGGGTVEAPPEPKPAASALTDEPPVTPAKLQGLDLGPACGQCGGMMQRTGSCYTCSSCGNNTGCG